MGTLRLRMLVDQIDTTEDHLDELRKRFREQLRADSKGKQTEIAADIGVPLPKLNDMINGRRPINRETRKKLRRWVKD